MTFHSVSHNFGYLRIESFRHNIVVRQLVCGNQACNGFCGCQLHFLGDLGSATFQSTLENTGECHHVVYLIGEITASGSYDTGTVCFREASY